jgi:hypothetical protein
MKTQLLCTFTKKPALNESIDIIISCNDILYDKIYTFEDVETPNNLMCTYNVEYDENFMEGIPNTISLHRKKQTNTLYTINALNDVIRKLNDGILDKTFIIPWENYQNSVLLYNENGLVTIKTKLYKIVNVKTWSS